MSRLLHNLAKLPQRTMRSLRKRTSAVYRLQRAADRFARAKLSPQRLGDLSAIDGTTSDHECRLLFYLACRAAGDGRIVEIGAFKGKSTAWLAETARLTGKHLVSIDPHLQGTLEEFQKTVDRFDIASVATIHRAYSHDIGRNWTDPISFIWIDGGHNYEIVRQDIDDFTPHVQRGGFMVFDDVNEQMFPGVVRALHETLHADDAFTYQGLLETIAVFEKRG